MKAKDVLEYIPIECECEVTELENKVKNSTVKSYAVSQLCTFCEVKRQEDSLEAEKRREQEDIQLLISQKAQDSAEEELILDGVLEKIDGKLKKV